LLRDVARLDMPRSARLGGKQPDVTPVGQWSQGIDQRVNEVAVFLPKPHEDHIDYVLVVLIDKLHAFDCRDRLAQRLVRIGVIAEFLYSLARFNAEPLGLAAFILRLAR